MKGDQNWRECAEQRDRKGVTVVDRDFGMDPNDDDDTLPKVTPPDLLAVLGFDPLEEPD